MKGEVILTIFNCMREGRGEVILTVFNYMQKMKVERLFEDLHFRWKDTHNED